MMRLVFMMSAALLLVACSKSLDDDYKRLESFVGDRQFGSSQDVWMEKLSPLRGEWDRIAIVFGSADDFRTCSETVKALADALPTEQWRCALAAQKTPAG